MNNHQFSVRRKCKFHMPIKSIRAPSGYEGYVSRKAAAAILGFASEFKVRQLERQGRLRPVRGVMGSAWYPRAAVEALREVGLGDPVAKSARGAYSDAALIAHLRGEPEGKPRTVVDLVADLGVPISRAERVYRFWLAHDAHPAAEVARTTREGKRTGTAAAQAGPAAAESASERRSDERLERDTLLQRMRDPDPRVRADAFEKLKKRRA
jgi:hypothetical protein